MSKRISDTTYQLLVPDKRLHKVVTHVNKLKPWKAPSTSIFLLVVTQDSEGSDHPTGRVNLSEEKMMRGIKEVVAGYMLKSTNGQ